jgi:hypothetical protein
MRLFTRVDLLRRIGLLALLSAGIPCGHAGATIQPAVPVLEQEAQSVRTVCTKCHAMQIVTDTPMGYDAWHETVQKMLDRGADATDDQLQDIMDWLHRTMTTIDVNSADTDELQTVLGVSGRVAQAIVARRNSNRFADIADLKSVPGIDASIIDAKARLIFFH